MADVPKIIEERIDALIRAAQDNMWHGSGYYSDKQLEARAELVAAIERALVYAKARPRSEPLSAGTSDG